VLLGPVEFPGTVLESEFAPDRDVVVERTETPTHALGLPDIKPACKLDSCFVERGVLQIRRLRREAVVAFFP
jgi:hypothetical protein